MAGGQARRARAAKPRGAGRAKRPVHFGAVKTSVGWMGVALSEGGIVRLTYPVKEMSAALDAVAWSEGGEPAGPDPRLDRLAAELDGFLRGRPVQFSVPPDLASGTPFQRRVWRELLRIPRGETRTYQQIARRLGLTRGARAVGAAVGANAIPFVVPCHRVVGSDGSLCGFAGGLPLKRRLLALEGAFG